MLRPQEFLQGVKDIARRIGAVLIFDEVTSGFRINIGGIHRTMGIWIYKVRTSVAFS